MPVLQVPPKPKSTTSSTQVMVDNALKTLNERNGSSLAAVKKFIAHTYSIDIEASSNRIKKYIKEGLENGKFVKTTGKGISGSFKISPTFKEPSVMKMKFKQPKMKKQTEASKVKENAIAKKTELEKTDEKDQQRVSKLNID